MNIFLATPISMSLKDAQKRADLLETTFTDSTVELAQNAFQAVFREKGWDGFIDYVATGIHFVTRRPLFDLICCVTTEIGHATAQIVSKSLHTNKRVIFLDVNDSNSTVSLHRVDSVLSHDPDNWQSGWQLSYSSSFLHWRTDDPRIKQRA